MTRTAGTLIIITIFVLLAWTGALAFDVQSTISPSITASPIEVVIWVTASTRPTRRGCWTQQGLDQWADVPTSEIDFDIVDVIHAPTNPGKLPHQIQIIVGNTADLTSGGASSPSGGNPGTWFGAVADVPTLDLVPVTTHEIGHTLGFVHSTVSVQYPVAQRPIMHFAIASPVLLPDDIAAVSWAYPNPSGPALQDVAGTIRGRVVSQATGLPITGVNVVAVDQATGAPAVARISGAGGVIGAFDLPGLPPATYEVHFLDGHSYRGSFVGLGTTLGLGGEFQADNFTESNTGAIAVAAGTTSISATST